MLRKKKHVDDEEIQFIIFIQDLTNQNVLHILRK